MRAPVWVSLVVTNTSQEPKCITGLVDGLGSFLLPHPMSNSQVKCKKTDCSRKADERHSGWVVRPVGAAFSNESEQDEEGQCTVR